MKINRKKLLFVFMALSHTHAQTMQQFLSDYKVLIGVTAATGIVTVVGLKNLKALHKKHEEEAGMFMRDTIIHKIECIRDQLMNSLNGTIFLPISYRQWEMQGGVQSIKNEEIKQKINSKVVHKRYSYDSKKNIRFSTVDECEYYLALSDNKEIKKLTKMYENVFPSGVMSLVLKYVAAPPYDINLPLFGNFVAGLESIKKINPLWVESQISNVVWITERNLGLEIPYFYPDGPNAFYMPAVMVNYVAGIHANCDCERSIVVGPVAKFFEIYFKLLPLLVNGELTVQKGAFMEDYVGRPEPELLSDFGDTHYFPIARASYSNLQKNIKINEEKIIDPKKCTIDFVRKKVAISLEQVSENSESINDYLSKQMPKPYCIKDKNEDYVWVTEKLLIHVLHLLKKIELEDDENFQIFLEMYKNCKDRYIHKITVPLFHYKKGCDLCNKNLYTERFLKSYYLLKQELEYEKERIREREKILIREQNERNKAYKESMEFGPGC